MDKDNPMASTMNTMNVTMPLFSVFMVFSLPTGIGLYWVVSAVVRIIQQVIINKSLREISIDDLIEKNKEKAKKKKEKQGIQETETWRESGEDQRDGSDEYEKYPGFCEPQCVGNE